MAKICYTEKNFREKSLRLIKLSNEILADLHGQGYDVTLRQLYYQLVSKDLIPNNQKEYDNLGSLINDARLAGLIDWNALVDRTRFIRRNSHWDGPRAAIESLESQYQIDKWEGQRYRPEVWVEKDALVGVIERVCRQNDVPFFSCRGYTSQTEMWEGAQRLCDHRENDQIPIIIHLGDHDPSGIDMSRDIEDRLRLFCGEEIEVRRIALNMDQVRTHKPPPNPAKMSDCRAEGYIQKFGTSSWELDALPPSIIDNLIQDEIDDIRELHKYKEKVSEEKSHKKTLLKAASKME